MNVSLAVCYGLRHAQRVEKGPVPSLVLLADALQHEALLKEWQVGDGREERLATYVLERARFGDVADVIRVIPRATPRARSRGASDLH